MRDAEVSKFGVKSGGTYISNLRYADDSALIEESGEEIVQLTNSVNEVGNGMNLRLNVKKTKLLVAGADPDEVHNIEIDGETVEQVDHFKYLWSTKYNNATAQKTLNPG